MTHFQTIGIIGKRGDPEKVKATIERLVSFLRSRLAEVYFDPVTAALTAAPHNLVLDSEGMGRRCDLVVVVGGDGTLLTAARAMACHGVPLVGINLGRLGFLVDVSPESIESCLDMILAGGYASDERTMLAVEIPEVPSIQGYTALNDVVIHKWNTPRMIEFETYIDGVFVNAQRADGIIISTPTGSTAYALSGGGPLLDPALDTVVLVPICPHTLSSRPLVVSGESEIEIRICRFEQGQVQITCDGQTNLTLMPRTRVLIRRSEYRAHLLHPKGHDHYQILRAKFGWGGHPSDGGLC